jgi:hypothetical protein
VARVGGDALPAASSFARQTRGQLPAVRKRLGVDFEPHLRSLHRVRRCGRFIYKPLGDDLAAAPPPAAQHAVGDSGKITGRHAQPVRGMPPDGLAAVEVLKPPALDAQRSEERLNSELVVGLARNRLTHQRGMVQRVRRVAARGAGVERQLLRARVAALAEHVLPRALVGRPWPLDTARRCGSRAASP